MRRYFLVAAGLSFGPMLPEARAVEDVPAYLPGSSLGVPMGLLPAPGLYASFALSHFSFRGHDNAGRETPAKLGTTPGALSFLYVNDFKVFGASYAFGFLQPARYQTLDTPALKDEQFGAVNSILNVGTLSWKLGDGLNVSLGQDIYLKDGSYRLGTRFPIPTTAPVSVGRNYWTFQPRLAVTYLADGWTFTDSMLLNFNTENTRTRYQSGTVLINEATLTKRIGVFEVGLASVYMNQLTSDKQFGEVLLPIPRVRGLGKRLEYLSLGPMIGYNTGIYTVQIYYQQNLVARNFGGGSQIWSRISLPLYTAGSNSPAQIEAAGVR
jgi:hypothetical protein